ncbi:hypothetical protein [Nitratifractor sp.]
MQFNELNEIIEENTLPTISKKTRISVQNLEALLKRDWGRLKKVQALGFLSILEREYHLDLSDMRDECRAYYESHREEGEQGPVITPAPEPQRRGPSKGVLSLIVLLVILGASVYLYSPVDQGVEENRTTVGSERTEGFFDSVLTTAKGWFGSGEESSETMPEPSTEEPPAVQGAWARKPEPAGTNASTTAKTNTAKTENSHVVESQETNGSNSSKAPVEEKEEAQIITQVKKEEVKAEEMRKEAAAEENLSGEGKGEGISEISKMILAATAGTDATAEQVPLEPQSPSFQEQKQETENPEKAQSPSPKKPESESAKEAAPAETPKKAAPAQEGGVISGLVILHPRSKIWVGYTDLRTMKRTAKVTADDLSFDTAAGDYILAVGHGLIDFKTRNGIKKLNDGKRHFFMIAKGDVREISHEEFQRLNKSKVW